MGNYVIPDVVKKFSGVKVDLWNWIEKEIGNRDGTFEINQSKLAEKFDVSRKSIQNALKTFISANLLEKVESRTGRGVHPLYRLIWTFREQNEKSATPSRVKGTTPRRKLTKGSKTFRYYACKFRTLVESSPLRDKSGLVVGKLLNFLVEKSKEIAKSWLIYFKRWIDGPKRSLKDFFVYFHQTLKELAKEKLKIRRTEKFIQERRERRKEVGTEYEDNPPPKSSDYARFSDYLEAMEEWSDKRGGDEPSG